MESGQRTGAYFSGLVQTHWDDIPGEVGDEQEVAVQQVVVCDELLKVGAGEDGNLAPCTIEVCSDDLFMAPLGVGKVDVAEFCGAGCGGDAKDNMVFSLGSLGGRVVVDGVPQPSIASMACGLALRRDCAEPDAMFPPSAAGGRSRSATGSMVVAKGEEYNGHEDHGRL